MNEDQRKHLDMLQAVIARLAGNSFSIKGWAVALVAVLGGFAAKDADPRFVFVLWLPALCFWGLDAYYLRQERLFRALYNDAATGTSGIPIYSMNIQPYQTRVPSLGKVARSPTVLWIHLPILFFVLVLSVFSALHLVKPPVPAPPPQPKPVLHIPGSQSSRACIYRVA